MPLLMRGSTENREKPMDFHGFLIGFRLENTWKHLETAPNVAGLGFLKHADGVEDLLHCRPIAFSAPRDHFQCCPNKKNDEIR